MVDTHCIIQICAAINGSYTCRSSRLKMRRKEIPDIYKMKRAGLLTGSFKIDKILLIKTSFQQILFLSQQLLL
jgi:hypothetical protein